MCSSVKAPSIYIFFMQDVEILMRESAGGSFNEIDSFIIPLTFPPGVQEVRFVGDDEVAAIILSADVICIEPDICGPSPAPSEVSSGDIKSNNKSWLVCHV